MEPTMEAGVGSARGVRPVTGPVVQIDEGRCVSMRMRHLGWEFKEFLPPIWAG